MLHRAWAQDVSDLIKKIASLPKILRAAWGLERAWDLYVYGQYAEADSVFSGVEQLLDTLTVHAKIMKGSIKFRLRDREGCAACFKEAWSELEHAKMSEPDKKYLRLYIYGILSFYAEFGICDISDLVVIEDADVRLSDVSKKWKRRFPIRDHPDWATHGIGHSVSNETGI